MSNNSPKQTRAEQREERRKKVAEFQKAEKAKKRRGKIIAWTSTGVGVLAVGALVGGITMANLALTASASTTSPNNMATDGFILTSDTDYIANKGYSLADGTPETNATALENSDVPHVEVYYDFGCPHCAAFEEENGQFIADSLAEQSITYEARPIIAVGSGYSFAGNNAIACVADIAPEKFLQAQTELFTDAETKTKADINPMIRSLSLDSERQTTLQACTQSNVYGDWLTEATDHAFALTDDAGQPLVTGTPAVFIDGVKYPYAPNFFQLFLTQVMEGKTPQEVIAENQGAAATAPQSTPGQETAPQSTPDEEASTAEEETE